MALQEERDKLLAEKESWVNASASGNVAAGTTDEAKREWASEKAELIKARDLAASQAKVRVTFLALDVP